MAGKGHTFAIYYINTYVLPLMMLLKKLNINRLYYNYAHLISRAVFQRYIKMVNIVSTHVDAISQTVLKWPLCCQLRGEE